MSRRAPGAGHDTVRDEYEYSRGGTRWLGEQPISNKEGSQRKQATYMCTCTFTFACSISVINYDCTIVYCDVFVRIFSAEAMNCCTLSFIIMTSQGEEDVTVNTENLLSCDEYRPFWITWEDGHIRVSGCTI